MVEEIAGDLNEDFESRLDQRGARIARLMFCLEALAFLRPGMLRPRTNPTTMILLRSYFTMSIRSMVKKPLFTLINLFGLTVGLGSVIVIAGYVLFMFSYDRTLPNAEDIYRITMRWKDDGIEQHSAMAVSPVAKALDKTLHSVKRVVRIYPYSGLVSREGIQKTREMRFCFADSGFFDMFPWQAIRGNLKTSLNDPFALVLTQEMALKYFGTTDVLGQELFFEDERAAFKYHITAVVEDIPQNSHFNPGFLASMSSLNRSMPWFDNWHHPPMYVYAEAATGYDPGQLQLEIEAQIIKTHPVYIKPGQRGYGAQPVTDIHLKSNLTNEWQPNSNLVYAQILAVVAALILFLACINYVNLATARGTERAREVGMRKVMGAVRGQLVGQFLGESFFTALFALVLAGGLAELIFKFYINDLLEKQLSIFTLFGPQHLFSVLGGLIALTLVAGLYPAFFLSSYRPASMLRGSASSGGGLLLQRGMVVFQFVVSCLLITGMLVIQRQTMFMREKKLGFEKEQLVAIRLFDRDFSLHYAKLKNQLLGESSVRHVAVASTFPMKEGFYGWPITPEGHTAEERLTMKAMSGDRDLVKALNLEIVAGRDFSNENAADTTGAFIINEAAARSLNWSDAIGRDFELIFYGGGEHRRKGKVIGVVKDFHFESLYNRIEPLVIFYNTHPYYCDYLLVKLAPGNLVDAMSMLETNWKAFSAEKPLEYSIADDDLSAMFRQETKLRSMFTSFTGLSILVSCLGLFGLSAYTISRRVREIGIRKVLGASVRSLFALLSREYAILILLSQVIAWPLGWWFAGEWLSTFAYRIEIPVVAFAATLGASLHLGLLSISLHIVRAVRANPAQTLRIE